MIIKLNSYVIRGLNSEIITVEASVSPGLAKFEIIGLADTAIKESKERVFKSILENGYKIPPGNITINLAPAKIKKRGPLYDLPIFLGILLASRQITSVHSLEDLIIAGELSLDGQLREVEGVFINALQQQQEKIKLSKHQGKENNTPHNSRPSRYLVPQANYKDFRYFPELNENIFLVSDVATTIEQLQHPQPLISIQSLLTHPKRAPYNPSIHSKKEQDFSEIIGNDTAKLAIQLSIIAKLNLLLVGPPGGGKSMLMKAIPSVLPKLKRDESLESTRIHHACFRQINQGKSVDILEETPFREVHNSIHTTSLIGGGRIPEPGEISLAHHGFLFLDELSEYGKDTLQSLRIPMERKQVTINRVEGKVTYPCNFTLLACSNPCACGYYGDAVKICSCSKNMKQRFYGKISGPIIDRFDLIIFINQFDKTSFNQENPTSLQIKERISKAITNKNKIANPFEGKNLKELFSEYPKIEEVLMKSIERGLISFRKVNSILKTSYALQLYYEQEFNQDILFQAIEMCRNKFDFSELD